MFENLSPGEKMVIDANLPSYWKMAESCPTVQKGLAFLHLLEQLVEVGPLKESGFASTSAFALGRKLLARVRAKLREDLGADLGPFLTETIINCCRQLTDFQRQEMSRLHHMMAAANSIMP